MYRIDAKNHFIQIYKYNAYNKSKCKIIRKRQMSRENQKNNHFESLSNAISNMELK